MHAVTQRRTPPLPGPHRPRIVRRIMSVVFGFVTLGLVLLLWAVSSDPYFDAVVSILVGLLVVAFGAGAVVLWYPEDQLGPRRKILLWAAAAVIVAVGIIFFVAVAAG